MHCTHAYIVTCGSSLVCVSSFPFMVLDNAHLFLSVLFFLVSLYLVLQSFFHLFLNPAMVPDENSMEDPLCNSSFGSMVSLDYVTPDTVPMRSMKKICTKNSVLLDQGNLIICLKTFASSMLTLEQGNLMSETAQAHTQRKNNLLLKKIVTLHHLTRTTSSTVQSTRRSLTSTFREGE